MVKTPSPSPSVGRDDRERSFWDEHAPDLARALDEYSSGPDELTSALLDALEPLAGARVLDFACGTGVTSAWLADRGARVVGLDLSPESTERADRLCRTVGADVEFVTGPLEEHPGLGAFDRLAGRFALHHTDCSVVAPMLATHLAPGGTGAFVETMDANPLLRFARSHLVGRFGIPRFGTLDEQPLTRHDLETLRTAFGHTELRVPQMSFLRILDRQVLRYRNRAASSVLGVFDDTLLWLGLGFWSYHQVLIVRRADAR
jgi:SAM-dependent methyltransferase